MTLLRIATISIATATLLYASGYLCGRLMGRALAQETPAFTAESLGSGSYQPISRQQARQLMQDTDLTEAEVEQRIEQLFGDRELALWDTTLRLFDVMPAPVNTLEDGR